MQNAGRTTLTTHNTEYITVSCVSFQNGSEDAKSNSTLQRPLGPRWGVGSGVRYDSPVTAGLQTAATPSPQMASLQQCLLLHPSQTQTEFSRQRDSTPNGLGLSVAEKGLPPASIHAPMGI